MHYMKLCLLGKAVRLSQSLACCYGSCGAHIIEINLTPEPADLQTTSLTNFPDVRRCLCLESASIASMRT